MKATGIVRKIDDLGRIVLPKELRGILDIGIKEPIEIYVDNEKIYLKKYNASCVFCGSTDGMVQHHNKYICKNCMDEIRKETI